MIWKRFESPTDNRGIGDYVTVIAWDLFISHASEDKEAVVLPLSEALRRAGLRVWLDRQEIRIGDSIRTKIDEGLANSRFGVVILSPAFLGKNWPKNELNALFSLEELAARHLILPVWHELDKAAVARYSPILADRMAGTTADGIDALARELIAVITMPDRGALPTLTPTPLRLLVEHLDSDPSHAEVVHFLSAHPTLVKQSLGPTYHLEWSVAIGSLVVDLVASEYQETTDETSHQLIQFGPVSDDVVRGSEPSDSVTELVAQLDGVRRFVVSDLRAARSLGIAIESNFHAVVVTGRRSRLSPFQQQALREYHDQLVGTRIHTYDWLLDSRRTSQ
jgi:hypothetical protein